MYLKISILKTIQDLELIGKNDLSFDTYDLNSKNELGSHSLSVRGLMKSLKYMIKLFGSSSDKLAETANAMKNNSNEITELMNQINCYLFIADYANSASTERVFCYQLNIDSDCF